MTGSYHLSLNMDHLCESLKQHLWYVQQRSINRPTVGKFFDQLGDLYDRYKFEMHDIYNLNKTGCTTAQQSGGGMVAPTGKKRIGSVTSAERGELVIVLYAVGASGVVVPPMFVFPRVNFRNNFIVGGSLECIGGASKSGWMNEDLYVNFIKKCLKL